MLYVIGDVIVGKGKCGWNGIGWWLRWSLLEGIRRRGMFCGCMFLMLWGVWCSFFCGVCGCLMWIC